MSEFLANLTLAEENGCIQSATDSSNYTTTTDQGHAASNFSEFLRIEITRPVDADVYLIETSPIASAENDQIIAAPSVTPNIAINLPASWTIVNGTYTGRITAIPTWNALSTFEVASKDVVFYNAKIYKCIAASSVGEQPDITPASWEEITWEDMLADLPYYSKYVQKSNAIAFNCITENTVLYETTLLDSTGAVDIAIDTDCDTVTFGNNSNYDTNDENGHAEANFTDYLQIVLIKPDGTEYVLGTLTGDDEAITPPSFGAHEYDWDMATGDTDGRYEVYLKSVPTWATETYYNSFDAATPVIVWYDNKLWKAVTANLNSPPALGNPNWEEYTGDLKDTRYCFDTNMIITCRTIDPCYAELVKKYTCMRLAGKCPQDMCDNPIAAKTWDLRIIKDDISYEICAKNWSRVDDLINLARTTCAC